MHRVAMMLRRRTERFHMVFHVMFGIICGYFVHDLFPESNSTSLIFWGILGSVLPDIDHFLYFYLYGRNSDYSKTVRKYIRDKKIRQFIDFVKFNHKKQTGIYSHNILSVLLALYMFSYFVLVKDKPTSSVVALSFFMHYVFDMAEDFLFMKKLNPNWYLRFKNEDRRQNK